MICRPIKAPTEPIQDEQLNRLLYPVVGSPKLDGFRCLVGHNGPLTSTMKPFLNRFVQQELSVKGLYGLDGEIIVGPPNSPDAFHNTSGPVRRFDGEPDFKLYVFDSFVYHNQPYYDRWLDNPEKFHSFKDNPRIIVLEQRVLYSPKEVLEYEQLMLAEGYEGAMIRDITGRYKEGRCTFNELNIFKRKPFVDAEAVIVGFTEAMLNLNEAYVDERGLSKRSSAKDGKVPKGTLGSFILKSPLWGKAFSAAPGKNFDERQRQRMWDLREHLLNTTVTFKYQKHGSRERPRIPSVIKLRPNWDLTTF